MAFQSTQDWIYGPESWGIQPKKKEESAPIPVAPAISESITETAAETITKSQQTAGAAVQEKAQALARNETVLTPPKKKAAKTAGRSRSVFTSPLGLAGEATTIKKTLLGE